MRSQTERQAFHPHLDDASQRIALLSRCIDEFLELWILFRIERVDDAFVTQFSMFVDAAFQRCYRFPTQFDNVTKGLDSKMPQQLGAQCADSNADRRLSRAGSFQDAANLAQVFDGTRQITMARTRALQIVESLKFVIAVDDLKSERTAERCVFPNAREYLNAIGFDPLASTTAISTLPSFQFRIDRIGFKLDASWEAIDGGQQRFAMGFSSCPIPQHDLLLIPDCKSRPAAQGAPANPPETRLL